MKLRKICGMICIGASVLGLILSIMERGLFGTLFLFPGNRFYVVLFVAGCMCASAETADLKCLITSVVAAVGSCGIALSNLLNLRGVTPVAIMNFCYLPLTVVLCVVILAEKKDRT